jgi:hypothetical protein
MDSFPSSFVAKKVKTVVVSNRIKKIDQDLKCLRTKIVESFQGNVMYHSEVTHNMLPDLSDEEQKAFYCMAKEELQQRGFTVRGKITSGVLSLIIFSNIPRTNEMDRVLRLYSDEGSGETLSVGSVPTSPNSTSSGHEVKKKRVRSSSIPTNLQTKTLTPTTRSVSPATIQPRSADVSPRLDRAVSGIVISTPTLESKQSVSKYSDTLTHGKDLHPDTPRPKQPANRLDVQLTSTTQRLTKRDISRSSPQQRLSRSATHQLNKQSVSRSSSATPSRSPSANPPRSSSATPSRSSSVNPPRSSSQQHLSRSATQQLNKQSVSRSSSATPPRSSSDTPPRSSSATPPQKRVSHSDTRKPSKQGISRPSSATPQSKLSQSVASSQVVVPRYDTTSQPLAGSVTNPNSKLVEKTGELNMAFIMDKLKQSNNPITKNQQETRQKH